MQKVLRIFFILLSFGMSHFSAIAIQFKTVSEFSVGLDTYILNTVKDMVELADYVNGTKLPLTADKKGLAAQEDQNVIFKYLAIAKRVAGENQESKKAITQALLSNPKQAQTIGTISEAQVKTHCAIQAVLFNGGDAAGLESYLGDLYKDFVAKVDKKFGETFKKACDQVALYEEVKKSALGSYQ